MNATQPCSNVSLPTIPRTCCDRTQHTRGMPRHIAGSGLPYACRTQLRRRHTPSHKLRRFPPKKRSLSPSYWQRECIPRRIRCQAVCIAPSFRHGLRTGMPKRSSYTLQHRHNIGRDTADKDWASYVTFGPQYSTLADGFGLQQCRLAETLQQTQQDSNRGSLVAHGIPRPSASRTHSALRFNCLISGDQRLSSASM